MIALGDIARYKEQANETNNYGKARRLVIRNLEYNNHINHASRGSGSNYGFSVTGIVTKDP